MTNEEKRILKRMFKRIEDELEPKLALLPAANKMPHLAKAIVAQNFIRSCMEVALDMSSPFQMDFLTELATRIAAYLVTAAQPEYRDTMMVEMVKHLPAMVANKVKEGATISTEWDIGKVVH